MSSQALVIHVGCIAGGVIVVVILILGILYILYMRAKSRRKRKHDVQPSDDEETGTPAKRRCIRNTILDFADEPKGLPNLGETCYMNSMLQCLAWSPCLRAQLEDQIKKQQTYPNKGNRVAKTLLNVLESYHDDSSDNEADDDDCFSWCYPTETKSMRNNIYAFLKSISETNGRFGDGVQEDTFEFYNILLSTLQDEALENIRRPLQDDTYDEHIMRHCGASRLFGGKFLMTYCYEACGHVDTVFQPFTSLSIPVTKNPDGLSNSAVTLTVNDSDGNSAYYVSSGIGGKYGSLSDQNQLLKEKMDVDSTNRIEVKSSNISKPPENKLFSGLSLAKGNMDVIQTGVEWGLEKLTETETMEASEVSCRICKDGNVGVLYKKLQVISLPPVLVLQINRFNQRDRDVYKVNDQVSYPKFLDMTRFCSVSMEQVSGASGKLTPGESYSLFGVVNHQGSMKGGHYFAYIKTTHRNVNSIQNQLQKHEWKDPEKMASSIRTQLEDTWHEERRKESDDSNLKSRNRMHSGEDQHCFVDMDGDSDTWFGVSDSSVKRINEDTVMQSEQAYILMYERV